MTSEDRLDRIEKALGQLAILEARLAAIPGIQPGRPDDFAELREIRNREVQAVRDREEKRAREKVHA